MAIQDVQIVHFLRQTETVTKLIWYQRKLHLNLRRLH